jgi:hypothetical protein
VDNREGRLVWAPMPGGAIGIVQLGMGPHSWMQLNRDGLEEMLRVCAEAYSATPGGVREAEARRLALIVYETLLGRSTG